MSPHPVLRVGLLLVCLVSAAFAQDLPIGQVVPKLTCAGKPEQSYAIYVPHGYTTEKRYPIVYCFDPAARGSLPVERFQTGAEKYGVIVVCSNNSRNGPWEPTAAAFDAVWRDTHARFSLDPQRVYGAGMSGGSRVALQIGAAKLLRGVIACSAGFTSGSEPKKIDIPIFGVAGIEDFNYIEMRSLDDLLEEMNAPHRFVSFAGTHEWPPAEVLTEALGWLDLQAMRSGARPKDDSELRRRYDERLASIAPLAPAAAWLERKSLAADFKGLLDTADLEKRVSTLAVSPEVKAWKKQQRTDANRQSSLTDELFSLAGEDSYVSLRARIAALRQRADATADSPDRLVARRVLGGLTVGARENLRGFSGVNEFSEAAKWAEIVTMLQPDRPQNWYELARLRALDKSKPATIAALQQAVTVGFKDRAKIDGDKAFDLVRSTPEFQAVIGSIKE